jgi:hypothetical protein
MPVFQVPVWFNIEADDAEHAQELVEDALDMAIMDTDEESALALREHAIESNDIIAMG